MCCGANQAVALRPDTAILLGEETADAPRYLRVAVNGFLPKTQAGTYIYVKGSAVDQAIEEGKLEPLPDPGSRRKSKKTTIWVVTDKEGEEHRFPSWPSAKSFERTSGGSMRVEIVEADNG